MSLEPVWFLFCFFFILRTVPVSYNLFSESMVSTIALCAGSGGSVLKGVDADLYLTGAFLFYLMHESSYYFRGSMRFLKNNTKHLQLMKRVYFCAFIL